MDASTLSFIMELADLLGKAPCIPVEGVEGVEKAKVAEEIEGRTKEEITQLFTFCMLCGNIFVKCNF